MEFMSETFCVNKKNVIISFNLGVMLFNKELLGLLVYKCDVEEGISVFSIIISQSETGFLTVENTQREVSPHSDKVLISHTEASYHKIRVPVV